MNARVADSSRALKNVLSSRVVTLALCSALAACSGGGSERDHNGGDADGGIGDAASDAMVFEADAGEEDSGSQENQILVLTPDAPTHTIGFDGQPTIVFTAALTPMRGEMSTVKWSADHPELGVIDQSGVFTPTGAAGTVTITATVGAFRSSTTLKLIVNATEEGDHTPISESGAGGAGGVGGEGRGEPITDPAVRAALDAAPTVDDQLVWLYPYDGTVWPRGLLAPLLQWRHGTHTAEGVKIRIEVGTDYVYQGYFGRPAALEPSAPITRLPIPAKVWRDALYSGLEMKVALTIAAIDGAGGFAAFAPAKNLTWKIAPGSLKGTVYYNSYGTKLAEQMDTGEGSNDFGRFGGATLAIRGNSTNPELVAGYDSTDDDFSGCRVCHTVSGNGSLLLVQKDTRRSETVTDNLKTASYDLTNMNAETILDNTMDGKFGWAALSPDGAIALGNSGAPSNVINYASLDSSALYRVSDGSVLASPGLAEFVTKAASPVFSVDGSRVAFNLESGPGNAEVAGDGRSLVMMSITRQDENTYAFTAPTKLFTAENDDRPGWPFFLPDGSGVVFQLETAPAVVPWGNPSVPTALPFQTRAGARGQLWWTDLAGNAHPLNKLNGLDALPTGPDGHDGDTDLQYEPTVAPIVAGGYAWVVFTSRRLYGNVATRDPYQSDPRDHDLRPGNAQGPTTKKLWVAAIDMPPTPGTDPSHPAFYLPAQELFAGNSRAFWVPDACQENGATCESGDECCGGYCRADETGVPVCMDMLPPAACAQEYESCQVNSDCCDDTGTTLTCIANRCAQSGVLL